MPTKINYIKGSISLLHPKDKKKNELINFDGVVVSGNNDEEIRKNFNFERIRGNREGDILKHLIAGRISLESYEIKNDLGNSNME